jgi:nitrogen-specific signal transduction histidine kinase
MLVFSAFFIVLTSVFYTNLLVDELIKRDQSTVRFYADIYRKFYTADAKIEDLLFLSEKLPPTITFPLINTDKDGLPMKSADASGKVSYKATTLNVDIDTTLTDKEQYAYLVDYIKKMRKNYEPITLQDSTGKILAQFYYTHSALVDKLQLFPFIEIIVVATFVLIGYIAFSNIRRSEESKVWVGMAKEAAHQLGTPLSSMMAWMEILKYNKDDPQLVENTIDEMGNDISRLNIIARRFSKIGSMPEMKVENISQTIENVCLYFEKRLPHLGRKVEIVRNIKEDVMSEINLDLFQWVIENLMNNAAESIESKAGLITIDMRHYPGRKLIITVSDNGKGMTGKQKRQVFHPGFTTKKRGWGLGLSLCRRIIEEYHNGKIFIRDTAPGKGSVFVIDLPLNKDMNS